MFQGVFFAWIGTAAASEATRSMLFWIGMAMIFLMLPVETWWRLQTKPTAA